MSPDHLPDHPPVRIDRRALLGLLPLGALLAACGADDDGPGGDAGSIDGDDDRNESPVEPAAVLTGAAARRPADPAEAAMASRSMNQLGIRLLGQLVDGATSPNVVLSPASIAIALAMTRAGAVGLTAQEMDDILGVTGSADELHRSMNALNAELTGRAGTFDDLGGEEVELVLSLANAPWLQSGLAVEPSYLDLLAGEYGAGLRVVDFLGDAEGARADINAWVGDQTRDRIPELLGEGAVTPDTRLVLVNAVYLKAPWSRAFLDAATTDGTFLTLDGDEVEVPLMGLQRQLPYAKGAGWQAVELAYAGEELAMLLVLPESEQEFVRGLDTALLAEIVDSLTPAEVILRLPRFDIGTSTSLRQLLQDLGMVTAFTGDADFTGITTEEQLVVADVIHESNITVDEDGTEAAAATAVLMEATSAPIDEPVEVTFDRPFLFAVRDRITGAITFLGRIGDPSVSRS